MERVNCIICGADDGWPIFNRDAPRYVVCRQCGFTYENPRPNFAEMLEFYRSQYYESRPPRHPTERSVRGETICGWADGRISPDDLIVEVGCGNGAALNHVRQHFGCSVVGVEPSESQAEIARKMFGLRVVGGGFETADVGHRKAKLVFLFHVLEHLHDPIAALRKCCTMLSDDGMLFIEVPNILQPNAKKRLSGWFTKEHVSYFSPSTLTAIVARAGFSPHRIEATNAVRLLAFKGGSAETIRSNEYWAVRRALWRHEAAYWPGRAVSRLLGRG